MPELILLCIHFKSLLKFCHINKIPTLCTHADFAIFYMLQQPSTLRQEFQNKKRTQFYIQNTRFSAETSKISCRAINHSLAISFYNNACICTQLKPNYIQINWQKCPLVHSGRALAALVPGTPLAVYIPKDRHELYSPH